MIRNPAIAVGVLLLVFVPMIALGGWIRPLHAMSPAVRPMAAVMPSRWAFEGLLLLESERRPSPRVRCRFRADPRSRSRRGLLPGRVGADGAQGRCDGPGLSADRPDGRGRIYFGAIAVLRDELLELIQSLPCGRMGAEVVLERGGSLPGCGLPRPFSEAVGLGVSFEFPEERQGLAIGATDLPHPR